MQKTPPPSLKKRGDKGKARRNEQKDVESSHSPNFSKQLGLMMIKIHCSPLRLENEREVGYVN